MTKDQSKDRIKFFYGKVFLILVGIACVALAFLADTLGLGGQMQKQGFGTIQRIILSAGVVFIIIAFTSKKISWMLAINLTVFLTFLLIIDNLLYLSAPYLPYGLVQNMSDEARIRRIEILGEQDSCPDYLFDAKFPLFYTGRPNYDRFDEFGYRNPKGYIKNHGKMDVLLIGDSFIEGIGSKVTVAEYMREMLKPLAVYSLGVGGQGVPHWKLNFERYVSSAYYKSPPQVVIFNYYGENDIADTHSFDRYKKLYGKIHPSFFRESLKLVQYMVLFKHSSKVQYTDMSNHQPVEEKTPNSVWNIKQFMIGNAEASSDADTSETVGTDKTKIRIALEAALDRKDTLMFDSIADAVKAVRAVNPNIRIILSYITATESFYESDHVQQENSKILKEWADTLKIDYIDGFPILREESKKKVIHEEGRHFNEEGYRIYSGILAKRVAELLNLNAPQI